jgi:hypothetical protein
VESHTLNQSLEVTLESPVVRTNPVTGWKSIFGAGHQIAHGHIDNVTERESELIKAYCEYLIPISLSFIADYSSFGTHCQEPRFAGSLQVEQERCRHLG